MKTIFIKSVYPLDTIHHKDLLNEFNACYSKYLRENGLDRFLRTRTISNSNHFIWVKYCFGNPDETINFLPVFWKHKFCRDSRLKKMKTKVVMKRPTEIVFQFLYE